VATLAGTTAEPKATLEVVIGLLRLGNRAASVPTALAVLDRLRLAIFSAKRSTRGRADERRAAAAGLAIDAAASPVGEGVATPGFGLLWSLCEGGCAIETNKMTS
jgi:hypothetical protein